MLYTHFLFQVSLCGSTLNGVITMADPQTTMVNLIAWAVDMVRASLGITI